MASKVFEFTTAPVPVDEQDEMLITLSEVDGFIGATVVSNGEVSVIKAYYPADESLDFGQYDKGWAVTVLPSTYLKPMTATIRKPADGHWGNYVRSLPCPRLQEAVVNYLATWYPDVADTFQVDYLG